MSDADIGGIAVEVEPSYQDSIIFCCQDRWQNGITCGSADERKV